jgi:hypothetical protein
MTMNLYNWGNSHFEVITNKQRLQDPDFLNMFLMVLRVCLVLMFI